MEVESVKKVMFFVLFAAVVVALAKFAAGQKAEWQGLTESQVRAKLDARIPARVPPETRSEISDKVVAAMRERGALIEDEAPDTDVEVETPDDVDASAGDDSPGDEQDEAAAG